MTLKDWKDSVNIPNAVLTTVLFLIINQALESSGFTGWLETRVDEKVSQIREQVN